MRVQVTLAVHVLEAHKCSTLDLLSSLAKSARRRVRLLLLQTPKGVIVMVALETCHYLLARTAPVIQLRGMKEEAGAFISQSDGGRAGKWQFVDGAEDVFFIEICGVGEGHEA